MVRKKKKKTNASRGITINSRYHDEFGKLTEHVRIKIRKLREHCGLTQEQMQEFEINLRQFQRIENGETENMTLANLFKIAKALQVDCSTLLEK